MKTKILLLAILLAGCASGTPMVQAGPPAVPPPMPDPRPLPPVSYQPLVWEPGHYDWTGGAYVWTGGRYVARETTGTGIWQPGHWSGPGGDARWRPGHWLKADAS